MASLEPATLAQGMVRLCCPLLTRLLKRDGAPTGKAVGGGHTLPLSCRVIEQQCEEAARSVLHVGSWVEVNPDDSHVRRVSLAALSFLRGFGVFQARSSRRVFDAFDADCEVLLRSGERTHSAQCGQWKRGALSLERHCTRVVPSGGLHR